MQNSGILDNDSDLWNLFREGDEVAFTKLLRKYSKPLFNYGIRLCQDKDFIRDCIQDVFLELWSRRARISATPSVKWYLFKAVRLRIFRERSKWNKEDPYDEDYGFVVEFSIETKIIHNSEVLELSSKIKHLLNTLPPRQQEIMYLRFYENLSFDSISGIMGISKQSVHNLLQKAYKSFRMKWMVILFLYTYFN